jgi:alpha-glucosidase
VTDEHLWWQRGVIYQVYPRSFQDSDGDGVGDLPGVLRRLDELQELGVDAIWLSPIFPSPMADFGYDVADYMDVDPLFGTLADLDALVAALHARGMHLLLDFVPNHTSDRHPWFIESRANRSAPKREWYVWRDPLPDGSPPNNVRSVFGGSAWEWDAATGQYYFHAFLKEQPDLDWSKPEVRAAMGDALRFWFERGVDGFRIDVIWMIGKAAVLRAREAAPNGRPDPMDASDVDREKRSDGVIGDEPGTFDAITGLRAIADEFSDRVLIGEIYLPLERLVVYYGEAGSGLHLPFNFQLIELDWKADVIAAAIARYESLLPPNGWPNWVLGNHDTARIASRVGTRQARIAAMLLLTLRGTPTIYYGDEIGMQDVEIPAAQERDPAGIREPGRGRDPERTPMRWDGTATAGFTIATPWLPMGDDVGSINVEAQRSDPGSVLVLYRRLIALRRAEPALSVGRYVPLGVAGDAMAFERRAGEDAFVVVLNLAGRPAAFPPGVAGRRGIVVVSTDPEREGQPFEGNRPLAPDEGLVVRLQD